jgi:hypothetical protein
MKIVRRDALFGDFFDVTKDDIIDRLFGKSVAHDAVTLIYSSENNAIRQIRRIRPGINRAARLRGIGTVSILSRLLMMGTVAKRPSRCST